MSMEPSEPPSDRDNAATDGSDQPPGETAGRRWATFPVALVIALAVTGIPLGVQGVGLQLRVDALDREAAALGRALGERITSELENDMERVEAIAEAFAADLERGEIGPDHLLERLKEASRLEPYLLGLTVAYAPYAYGEDRRLYAPFFNVESGEVLLSEDYYDYTDEQNRDDALWYQKAAREGRSGWVSGYGPAAGTTYVGYSVPFFGLDPETGDRRLRGVVNMSLSLESLNDLLNKENIGRLGGGILIDEDGLLLAHPNLDAARAGMTLTESARANGNPELVELSDRMKAGASGVRRLRIQLGGARRAAWTYYRPINESGWSLLIGIFENELPRARDELRRRRIGLAITVLVTSILATALALRVDRLREPRLWAFGAAVSLMMAATIVYIWGLADDQTPLGTNRASDSRVIGDLRGLDAFLDEQRRRADRLRLPRPRSCPRRSSSGRCRSKTPATSVSAARSGSGIGSASTTTWPATSPFPASRPTPRRST